MLGLGSSLSTGSGIDMFDPSSIDNLVLWLKVNANITADEDSSSGSISHSSNAGNMGDEDKINAWNAFGGTSINAVQTTTADKPLWETDAADFGGVYSGGTKHFDLSSDIVFDANTDFTIAIRVRPTDFSSRCLMGSADTEFIRINSNTVIRMKVNSTNRDFTLGSSNLADDKYITILMVRSDGSTGNINIYIRGEDSGYFDGTAAGTAFGSELQDAGEITVSNLMADKDGSDEYYGYMKDAIIYDGTAVDSTQREQLFDYLESQIY